jgi:hypothetical protein
MDQETLESAQDGAPPEWIKAFQGWESTKTYDTGASAQEDELFVPSASENDLSGGFKSGMEVGIHADNDQNVHAGDDIERWQPQSKGDIGFFKYTDNHISTHCVLPSAKLVALLEILHQWRRGAPDDKIIG